MPNFTVTTFIDSDNIPSDPVYRPRKSGLNKGIQALQNIYGYVGNGALETRGLSTILLTPESSPGNINGNNNNMGLNLERRLNIDIPADIWFTISSLKKVRDWEAVLPSGESIKDSIISRIINGILEVYTNEELLGVEFTLETQ